VPPDTPVAAVGESLPPIARAITREKIEAFEAVGQALRTRGHDRSQPTNIHTDPSMAQERGLDQPVASGQMSFAYLHELLARRFGIDFRQGGYLSVNFVKPVYAGDVVTARGVVTASELLEERNRVTLDVWLENQHSEKTAVGRAEVTVPSPLT
jgi:acyl dehydratase